MLVKIFVQEDCPNCPPSKALGEKLLKEGISVEFHDVKTSDGLAESLMFNVLSTPSTIVLNNNEVISSFLGTTPNEEDLRNWL